jgi:hypothetical protein
MNRNILRKAVLVSGALGSLVALPAVSSADDGALKRLVAEFDFFAPGQEAATAAEPPGIAIYRKTVDVPKRTNTLYLTLSTTGDTHDGAASCFTALLDGAFFNPGGQGAARCAGGGDISVPGWITLLKLPGQINDPLQRRRRRPGRLPRQQHLLPVVHSCRAGQTRGRDPDGLRH